MRREDFEQLYVEHAQQLFGFLVYRTGNRTTAEDLLSETFEAALQARHQYQGSRGSKRTWLYAIALNRLRDHARRRQVETAALPGVVRDQLALSEAPDAARQLEGRDQLARAFTVLSDEERECVALRFAADLTLKEIADTLQEPMTTIEGRVYRALRKLRVELGRLE